MTAPDIRLLGYWISGLASGFALGGMMHLHTVGLL